MRTAISFYQLQADEAELCRFLLGTGVVVARRHWSLPVDQEIRFGPLNEALRDDGGVFLICRECDIQAVTIDRYKSQGQRWHSVDPAPSPVLTYGREPLDQPVLYRSSLGASLDYVDLATGQRRQKELAFKRWAKSVVAWIKARCTEKCTLHGFDYAATPPVARAVAKGTIEIRN